MLAGHFGQRQFHVPLDRGMLEPMASACAAAEAHWDELLEARESHDKATRLARAGQPAVTRSDDT